MRENWDRINMRKRDRNCISWNTKNFVSSFYFLNSPFNFRICNFTLSFLFLFVLALFKHKYKHTHADCIHPCWHSYPVWALEKPLHMYNVLSMKQLRTGTGNANASTGFSFRVAIATTIPPHGKTLEIHALAGEIQKARIGFSLFSCILWVNCDEFMIWLAISKEHNF